MTQNPDLPCPHEHFSAQADVGRILNDASTEVVAYICELQVSCDDCGERFRWNGVQAGLSYRKPMCSVDEYMLNAPLRPASADPDFGMSLPGFAITWREGDDG